MRPWADRVKVDEFGQGYLTIHQRAYAELWKMEYSISFFRGRNTMAASEPEEVAGPTVCSRPVGADQLFIAI